MSSVYETFESYECPKCSGKGYIFGFSHVAGGVCFSCNGPGHRFTRRGQRDFEAWRSAVDALVTHPLTDVTPGVSVQLPGFQKYHRIASVEGPRDLSYGHIVNDEHITLQGYHLTFARPVSISSPVGTITQTTWEVLAESTVRIHHGPGLIPNAADFDSRRKAA